jgi:hypothetical protein
VRRALNIAPKSHKINHLAKLIRHLAFRVMPSSYVKLAGSHMMLTDTKARDPGEIAALKAKYADKS